MQPFLITIEAYTIDTPQAPRRRHFIVYGRSQLAAWTIAKRICAERFSGNGWQGAVVYSVSPHVEVWEPGEVDEGTQKCALTSNPGSVTFLRRELKRP